jgi:hypothetical protein
LVKDITAKGFVPWAVKFRKSRATAGAGGGLVCFTVRVARMGATMTAQAASARKIFSRVVVIDAV